VFAIFSKRTSHLTESVYIILLISISDAHPENNDIAMEAKVCYLSIFFTFETFFVYVYNIIT